MITCLREAVLLQDFLRTYHQVRIGIRPTNDFFHSGRDAGLCEIGDALHIRCRNVGGNRPEKFRVFIQGRDEDKFVFVVSPIFGVFIRERAGYENINLAFGEHREHYAGLAFLDGNVIAKPFEYGLNNDSRRFVRRLIDVAEYDCERIRRRCRKQHCDDCCAKTK